MGCWKPVTVGKLILKWMKSFTVRDYMILHLKIFIIESESESEGERV